MIEIFEICCVFSWLLPQNHLIRLQFNSLTLLSSVIMHCAKKKKLKLILTVVFVLKQNFIDEEETELNASSHKLT